MLQYFFLCHWISCINYFVFCSYNSSFISGGNSFEYNLSYTYLLSIIILHMNSNCIYFLKSNWINHQLSLSFYGPVYVLVWLLRLIIHQIIAHVFSINMQTNLIWLLAFKTFYIYWFYADRLLESHNKYKLWIILIWHTPLLVFL